MILLSRAADLLSAADPTREDFGNIVQQLAGQYQSRGFGLQAERIFQSAMQRAAELGEAHPTHLGVLMGYSQFLVTEQQEVKASAALERLIALAEKSPAGEAFRWNAYGHLARLREATGRPADAEALLLKQRTLPVNTQTGAYNPFFGRPGGYVIPTRRLHPASMLLPGGGIRNMTDFLVRQGRAAEAEKLLRQQLEGAASAPDTPLYQQTGPLQALANFLQQQQRWDEALAAYRQIYERYTRSAKPEDQRQGYYQLQTMAQIAEQAGRPQEVEGLYQQMIERAPAGPAGQGNTDRLHALANYSRWLLRQRRIDEAEKAVEQYSVLSADQTQQSWTRDQADLLRAEILSSRGDTEGAGKIHENLRARQAAVTNPVNGIVIGPLLQRAVEAAHAGRTDEAVTLAEQALASSDHATDANAIGSIYASLATTIGQRGHVEIADRLLRRGYAELQRQAEFDANSLLQFMHTYTQYLFSRKRWEEARNVIEARREQIIAAKGPDAAQLEEIFLEKIDLLSLQERRGEALPVALQLLTHEERIHGENSEPVLRALDHAASIYVSRQEFTEAVGLRQRALAVAEKVLSPTDFRRALILSQLATEENISGQRENAIAHMEQAVAAAARGNPGQADQFRQQLEQLRRQEQPSFGASPDGLRWFNTDRFSRTDGTKLRAPAPSKQPGIR